MKISIAMATYNGEKYLLEQLESFLIQEIKPDELVVCDDGSTDKTLEILNNFSEKAPFDVKIYKNKNNLGYSKNFEKAILLCSGDLIFLSDQDDVWFKNKVKEVLNVVKLYPNKKIFMHDALITDKKLNPIQNLFYQQKTIKKKNIENIALGCLTAFKKEIINILLPIPEISKHDIWIHKIGFFTETKYIILKVLQYWRRHDNNICLINAEKINRIKLIKKRIIFIKKTINLNPCDNLILKKQELQILRKKLKKQKYIKNNSDNKIKISINILKDRIKILQKPKTKRFFYILLYFLKGGYSNYNGIITAIKDLNANNYHNLKNK
jgi:glycosyltransferase involved in cell wall biosynthesis